MTHSKLIYCVEGFRVLSSSSHLFYSTDFSKQDRKVEDFSIGKDAKGVICIFWRRFLTPSCQLSLVIRMLGGIVRQLEVFHGKYGYVVRKVRNKIIGFELHSMSPPDVLLNDFDIDYCTSQLISTCALQLNWYLFVPYLAWLTTPHSS